MMVFYVVVALLAILAVAMLLPALLRTPKDDEDTDLRVNTNVASAEERLARLKVEHKNNTISDKDYEKGRREIESNLALDLTLIEPESERVREGGTVVAIVVALGVPILAGFLYLALGKPQAINPVATAPQTAPAASPDGTPTPTQADVEGMVAALAARLENEPDNVEGWYRLARSYMVLGRFEEALPAARKVHALASEQPAALLLMADALSMNAEGVVSGESLELVNEALTLEPSNPQALWMAGMAARQDNQPTKALTYWERLLPLLTDAPDQREELKTLIAATKAETGTASDAETPTQADTEPAQMSNVGIDVNVTLADALRDTAGAEDTVFIYARAVDGPPMPLAVIRKKVADLPVTVRLDDQVAMMPQMKLSMFEEVTIGARISKTDNATASSGDLEGSSSPVAPKTAESIDVIIDTVRP